MIDTHCHLTFPDFEGRVEEELRLCREHAVTGCITISTTTSDCLDALRIAKTHANVWCSSGVHPLYSNHGPHVWGNLRTVIADPKCVAWGELGLDNHYKEPAPKVQHEVLAEQLDFIQKCRAEGIDKPIVIHCREAFRDLLPILKQRPFDPGRYVFHCFTGTPEEARLVLDFGACISFTGVVTYRNARDVQDAARLVPPDRIMVETDAPFLAPEPRRGERPCRPWMTSLTARRVAELRGQAFDAFHEQVNANSRRFFGIE